MKQKSISLFRKAPLLACLAMCLAVGTPAYASIHTIQFGGSFGFAYSPSTLSVSVGDTIRWQGDFSMHPLSSTSVPTNAASFHQGSGSAFSYVVKVAGSYSYECDFHSSLGMTGSFTAVATGVENTRTSSRPGAFRLEQNFPNPFNPTTVISFDLPVRAFVSIRVYNAVGQEVATLVNGNLGVGSHSTIWNAATMPSGIYFCRLQAGAFTQTRKLVLLR